MSTKADDYPFLWAIYAANMILAGVMLNLTWYYAVSHNLVLPGTTPAQTRHITARQFAAPAVFLVSVIAEYLFPRAALGPYTLIGLPLGQGLADRLFGPGETNREGSHPGWAEFLWRAGTVLIWFLIISLGLWASNA